MGLIEFVFSDPAVFFGSLLLIGIFDCWFIAVLNSVCRIVNRVLRSVNIALRGWPPAHLDADGDFKPGVSE